MIAFVMPISQGYAHAILEAKKMMRFKSLTSLILTTIGIIVGGYLSTIYGLQGIIYGIFGALIMLQIVVLFYYHFKIGLDMKQYFTKALFPFLILFFVVSMSSYFAFKTLDESWLLFLFKGISYTLIFGLGLLVVLKREERSYFLNFIKNKAKT